jgi:cytochrome c-type biogenesis protein CcmE
MKKIIKKKFFFYSFALALFLLGYYFIIKTFEENMMFFLSPSEFFSKNHDKEIMLGGYVKDQSSKSALNKDGKTTSYFIITDFKKEILVYYTGQLPALFREGQGVIAKGKYDDENNSFLAKEILAKHDEKYRPEAYYKKNKTKKTTGENKND